MQELKKKAKNNGEMSSELFSATCFSQEMSSEARVTGRFATFLPYGFCLKRMNRERMGLSIQRLCSDGWGFIQLQLEAAVQSSAPLTSQRGLASFPQQPWKLCPVVVPACDSSTGEQRRRSPGTPVRLVGGLCVPFHICPFRSTSQRSAYIPLRANFKPVFLSLPSLLPILTCLFGHSLVFPHLPLFI